MSNEEAIVGRALKRIFIGAVLSSCLTGLTGCISFAPKVEPAPAPAKHHKVVRTTPTPKVTRYKKTVAKKVIKPAEEVPEKPPAIPALGGGTGSGGGGGSSW